MAKAVVAVYLASDFQKVRLIASENVNLTSPTYSPAVATVSKAAKCTVTGLKPNTLYYYGVLIDGVLQTQGRGTFKTFPVGASTFKVCFSSCSYEDSNNIAYDRIKTENPAAFIHMGDIHYLDIGTNDIGLFEAGYDRILAQPFQAALYGNIPTAYIWDDHDYGQNDGHAGHVGKPAAQTTYRRRFPHYTLPTGDTSGAIYQSFVIGRVRFIMTDIMSERSNPTATDNTSKIMFSETQLQWFYSQLLAPEPVKVWVNTKPWIGSASAGAEYWAGFTNERTKIANFIKNNGLQGKVMILSGDMHGLAIDNGTGADYATGGGADIPVFQAAPLDSSASSKGGPWTEGSVLGGSDQYGRMTVTDTGGSTIGILWEGVKQGGVVLTHSFNVTVT